MPSRVSLAGPAIVLLLVASTAASAQSAPPSPRRACYPSAVSLCKAEVTARDRAAVRACLIKNFDKVTPECQAAMKAVQASGGDKDAAPPKH